MAFFQWPEQGAAKLICREKWFETPNCISLILTSENSEALFSFNPGQFISLGVEIDGELHYRAYSISSIPDEAALQLTIKAVEGGKVSNYLIDTLQVGGDVLAMKPTGEFHVNKPRSQNITLISAGCGITPVMSMARTLLVDNTDQTNIHFIHASTCVEQLIYHQELVEMATAHPRFTLSIILEDASHTNYPQGRLTQADLVRFCPDICERTVFLCGPVAFMQSIEQHLQQLGMNMNNFYQESFTPTAEAGSETKSASEVQVYVPSFEQSENVAHGSLLLDAIEKAKLPIIAACRSGVCGSCKTQVTKGSFTRTSEQTLSAQEIVDGFVLACSCQLESDVEVML